MWHMQLCLPLLLSRVPLPPGVHFLSGSLSRTHGVELYSSVGGLWSPKLVPHKSLVLSGAVEQRWPLRKPPRGVLFFPSIVVSQVWTSGRPCVCLRSARHVDPPPGARQCLAGRRPECQGASPAGSLAVCTSEPGRARRDAGLCVREPVRPGAPLCARVLRSPRAVFSSW